MLTMMKIVFVLIMMNIAEAYNSAACSFCGTNAAANWMFIPSVISSSSSCPSWPSSCSGSSCNSFLGSITNGLASNLPGQFSIGDNQFGIFYGTVFSNGNFTASQDSSSTITGLFTGNNARENCSIRASVSYNGCFMDVIGTPLLFDNFGRSISLSNGGLLSCALQPPPGVSKPVVNYYCGDGICSSWEDPMRCPQDCLKCNYNLQIPQAVISGGVSIGPTNTQISASDCCNACLSDPSCVAFSYLANVTVEAGGVQLGCTIFSQYSSYIKPIDCLTNNGSICLTVVSYKQSSHNAINVPVVVTGSLLGGLFLLGFTFAIAGYISYRIRKITLIDKIKSNGYAQFVDGVLVWYNPDMDENTNEAVDEATGFKMTIKILESIVNDTKDVHFASFLDEYEPMEKEIKSYAEHLGIDISLEKHLMWVAKEGLKSPLPYTHVACYTPEKFIFYYSLDTLTCSVNHPNDDYYRSIITELRGGPNRMTPPFEAGKLEKHSEIVVDREEFHTAVLDLIDDIRARYGEIENRKESENRQSSFFGSSMRILSSVSGRISRASVFRSGGTRLQSSFELESIEEVQEEKENPREETFKQKHQRIKSKEIVRKRRETELTTFTPLPYEQVIAIKNEVTTNRKKQSDAMKMEVVHSNRKISMSAAASVSSRNNSLDTFGSSYVEPSETDSKKMSFSKLPISPKSYSSEGKESSLPGSLTSSRMQIPSYKVTSRMASGQIIRAETVAEDAEEEEEESVYAFLVSLGYGKYYGIFSKEGYDDMRSVKKMDESDMKFLNLPPEVAEKITKALSKLS